jgi:hypothetical protein
MEALGTMRAGVHWPTTGDPMRGYQTMPPKEFEAGYVRDDRSGPGSMVGRGGGRGSRRWPMINQSARLVQMRAMASMMSLERSPRSDT